MDLLLFQINDLVVYVIKNYIKLKSDYKKGKSPEELYEHANAFFEYILNRYGIEVKVLNHEKQIPCPGIILSNHPSKIDIAVYCKIPGIKYFGAKKELFKWPLFGNALEMFGMLKIDKSNPWKARKSLYAGADMVKKRNAYFFLFPEGEVSKDKNYKIREFKRGPFILSIDTELPITPIVSYGALYISPKGSLKVKPGIIYLKILDSFNPKDYYDKEIDGKKNRDKGINALLKDTRSAMEVGLEELIKKYKT